MKDITKTIIRLAAPYEAVAFDVFDTLLKRDVGKTCGFVFAGRAAVCPQTCGG